MKHDAFSPAGLGDSARVPGLPIATFGLALSLYAFEANRMSSFQSVGYVSPHSFWISLIVMAFLLCLFAACQKKPSFRVHRHPAVGFAIAVLYVASSVALLNEGLRFQVGEFEALAKIVQAATPLVLIMCWVECFAPYRARQAAVVYAMSIVVLGLLNVVTSFFRDEAAHAVVSMLPVASVACLYWFKDHSSSPDSSCAPRPANALSMQSFDRALAGDGGTKRSLASFLLAFVAPLFLFTFAFGNVHYSWVPAQDGSLVSFSIQFAAGVGTALGGLILRALVDSFWGRRKLELYPLMALPILLCALYLTAVLDPSLSFVYVVPLNIAQKIVLFLALMAPFLAPAPLAPLAALALSFASYYLGKALASFTQFVSSTFANSIFVMVAISGVLACLVIAMVLNRGMSGERKERAAFAGEPGQGGPGAACARPLEGEAASAAAGRRADEPGQASGALAGEDAAQAPSLPEEDGEGTADGGQKGEMERRLDACGTVAARHQLTKREEEVLQLLSEGMNAQSVAETLVVSTSTAKSHMRNIYAKLGVHAQNELIIMVHRAMEESGADSGQRD